MNTTQNEMDNLLERVKSVAQKEVALAVKNHIHAKTIEMYSKVNQQFENETEEKLNYLFYKQLIEELAVVEKVVDEFLEQKEVN